MERNVTTAAEIESMSPADRHADFKSSIVADLDTAPQKLVQQNRAKLEQIINDAEAKAAG